MGCNVDRPASQAAVLRRRNLRRMVARPIETNVHSHMVNISWSKRLVGRSHRELGVSVV